MAASPSSTPPDGNWRAPIELASKAGENCQITVDKVGGIHIAAYDTADANLLYAYLSSYNDDSAQVITVDSYNFTGTNIRIDTAISADENYIVPYIGYYGASIQKTKMAYLPGVVSASTTSTEREAVIIPNGADKNDDTITRAWEVTAIPSNSRYADNYPYSYVNIGVWKNANGVITTSTAGTELAYTTGTGLTTVNYGRTYGNGTINPVVAYATRVGTRGHLETAQMK